MRRRAWILAPVAAAAVCLRCGQSTAPGGGTKSAATHQLRVVLTDAPFPYDSVSRVDVYIVRVMASARADTGTNAGDTVALGLHTIAAPGRRINVLSLAGGRVESLGADSISLAATYQQLRVIINTDSSAITLKNGAVLTSATRPGIQWYGSAVQTYGLFLDAPIGVPDTGATIVIDFNAGRSFQSVGATTAIGFTFTPFIRAVNGALTGAVSGTVVDSVSGTPVPNAGITAFVGDPMQPESIWAVIATSVTDVDGAFQLPFVGPGSYIVGADGAPSSPYGKVRREGVQVKTGMTTAVGALQLPARFSPPQKPILLVLGTYCLAAPTISYAFSSRQRASGGNMDWLREAQLPAGESSCFTFGRATPAGFDFTVNGGITGLAARHFVGPGYSGGFVNDTISFIWLPAVAGLLGEYVFRQDSSGFLRFQSTSTGLWLADTTTAYRLVGDTLWASLSVSLGVAPGNYEAWRGAWVRVP